MINSTVISSGWGGGQGGDNSHKNMKITGNILSPQYTLHY